jgi:hypothetical protein
MHLLPLDTKKVDARHLETTPCKCYSDKNNPYVSNILEKLDARNLIVFVLMYLISSLALNLVTESSMIDLGDIIFHSTEPIYVHCEYVKERLSV